MDELRTVHSVEIELEDISSDEALDALEQALIETHEAVADMAARCEISGAWRVRVELEPVEPEAICFDQPGRVQ